MVNMYRSSVDKEVFVRRVKRLYDAWKKSETDGKEPFPSVDAISTVAGTDDFLVYCKSISLQIWLLGQDFNNSIMVISQKGIFFVGGRKEIEYLRPLESIKDSDVPSAKLICREKGKEKNAINELLSLFKNDTKKLGIFSKDKYLGAFAELWNETLNKQDFNKVDLTNAIASLLSVKEDSEIAFLKKACQLTTEVYQKYVKDRIMDIVDGDKKVKHSKLSSGADATLTEQKYIGNIDPGHVHMCYPPIIQSGGNYTLKFSATSDSNNLSFDVIISSLGVRYKSYCSNIIRTLLVNPSKEMQETYTFVVDLQEHLMAVLCHGTKLSEVYNAGLDYARSKKPNLVSNLMSTFGFAMGIEFRESSLAIVAKSTAIAQKGQVYNLSVGLSDLKNDAAKGDEPKKYALYIGDTVLVNAKGTPATSMTLSKKKLKNVGIFVKEEDDESESEEEKDSEKENKPKASSSTSAGTDLLTRGKRTAILDSKLRQDTSSEEKRKLHQKELAIQLNEKARQRLAEQSGGTQSEKVKKSNVSYKSQSQMPTEPEVRDLKIYVDKKYETVIVPIYGVSVPFHISTIKNISQSVEGEYTYLRINFFNPSSTMTKVEGSAISNTDATFIKEVTYRAINVREHGETAAPSSNLNNAFRLIKEAQKKFKSREAEEKEKEDLVKQDTLVISNVKGVPKLKDLYMRPNIVNKRMTGSLEAHVNGFRYTSVRGDKVDILYNNIKHAFFQPCDGEMIILLHFNLKHAIMFGKKKHIDVQFYTEVGEITTDLGKHQHMHDRDDLAAEQMERELRVKLKSTFLNFTEKVEMATKQEIEFDTPFKDLGFHGVPYRSTVLLQPTSGALVNLVEWPPFVITLEDIELVHFERVQFQLKNFDMVFILKDYHKKVVMVNAVPMSMLDHVKEWLNSCDIRYSEGIQSLNWAKIMKTIVEDPEGFFENGGWSFLDPESDAEGEEDNEDEEEDEPYEPSDAETEEESGEESEYSEASEDESDESEEDELGSSEESGKDWSELEEEAAKEDMRGGSKYEESPSKDKKGSKSSSSRHRPSSGSSSKKHSSSSHHGSSSHKSSGSRHHSSSGSSKDKKHSSGSHHKSSSSSRHNGSSSSHSKDKHRRK